MKYNRQPTGPPAVSDVGFVLLQIMEQQGPICGYEIDKLVEQREYRVWTDMGTTSIYVGLKKLARRGLVSSYIDIKKHGKGPLPKKFRLTAKGRKVLRDEIRKGLSQTRERDRRFDLAVAAIPALPRREVEQALHRRAEFLLTTAEAIKNRFKSLGGNKLPLNIKTLFKHSLFLIRQERTFLDMLKKELKQEQKKPGRMAHIET